MTSPLAPAGRMPAEWEEQEATWLTWPTNPANWPAHRREIESFFAELVAVITRFQPVRINADPGHHRRIRRMLGQSCVDRESAALFPHPSDDSWCRDHGPTFVEDMETGALLVVDWHYNAWGRKYAPWAADDAIPARVARALGIGAVRAPIVCEGGAIEVDGSGCLMTTESVLLNPNRNPRMTKGQCAELFRRLLGIETAVWLPGGLDGDDTDGHIDMIARYFRPGGIVASTAASGHPSARRLEENRALLRESCPKAEVIALPMADGPTGLESYANFVLVNGGVLVPGFDCAGADDRAREILRDCFPGRRILTVDSRLPLVEGGGLHCLTQQQPRGKTPL